MKRKLNILLLWAVVVAAILLAGCGRSTPPGPNAVAGASEQGNYLLLHWQEGLRVMIWDNFEGGHMYGGSGSTQDPVYREQGSVEADDGSGYSFSLETEDGLTATFEIDNQAYDLTEGQLFIIRATDGGQPEVRQVARDLSGIETTREGILAFGQSDPDVSALAKE